MTSFYKIQYTKLREIAEISDIVTPDILTRVRRNFSNGLGYCSFNKQFLSKFIIAYELHFFGLVYFTIMKFKKLF